MTGLDGMRWDGTEAGYEAICFWLDLKSQLALSLCQGRHITVPTRAGPMRMSPGDWLVRVAPGSYLPAKSYEAAEKAMAVTA